MDSFYKEALAGSYSKPGWRLAADRLENGVGTCRDGGAGHPGIHPAAGGVLDGGE
jgi:hypothetical protein